MGRTNETTVRLGLKGQANDKTTAHAAKSGSEPYQRMDKYSQMDGAVEGVATG